MKIKDLLTEDTWCQRALAMDSAGKLVNYADNTAVMWCLTGAACKCYKDPIAALQKIVTFLPDGYTKEVYSVTIFNDRATFNEVKELLERCNV